jgi:PAS domain S-box-containing protein
MYALVATIAPRGKRSSIELVLRKGSIAEQGALGEQFELLVSNVVDYAIFLLDPTGVIASWNEGAERIKGYRADEIIGRHFSIFYPVEDTRNGKPEWELEIARREGRYAEEGWRLRKDGTRFWASVVITALRDETGRLRGFGKVTRDLTERHVLEEQRNAERDAEAQRLREHATSMAALEQAKTEFLNLASHELRGPLTVIRGYNSMLEDGTIPKDQIPSVARLLEAKLAQMDLLIEQMLETARLEHDRLELSRDRFDVRWVAQEQLDIFRPLARGHHFIVESAREPLLVEGDRSRIATIVANFMDNAIKYSPDGGEICIMSGRRGAEVFVSVRDQGIGISADHMPRMFTRFGRLPTEENLSIAGTGLGLFLCKEISVRHGGDITVRSQPGEGSEFTLTLPSAR